MKQRRLTLFVIYLVFCAHSNYALYTSLTCTNYKTPFSKYNWNTTLSTVFNRLRRGRIVLKIAKLHLCFVNSLSTRFFRQTLSATLVSSGIKSAYFLRRFVFSHYRHRPPIVPDYRTLFSCLFFKRFSGTQRSRRFFQKINTMVKKIV